MPRAYRAIRPMFAYDKWRICRDDIVYILSGPEKGKTGRVLEIFKDTRVPQVIVEGRNLRKKKVPMGSDPENFFVVTMEAPLHYSQVQVVDPRTNQPVRVVWMYTPEGQKVRARKVENPTLDDILPIPPPDKNPRAGLVGFKDTPAQVARAATHLPTNGFPFRIRNLERIWSDLHALEGPAEGGEAVAAAAQLGDGASSQHMRAIGGGAVGGTARGYCSGTASATACVEGQGRGLEVGGCGGDLAVAARSGVTVWGGAAVGVFSLASQSSFAAAGALGLCGLVGVRRRGAMLGSGFEWGV